MAAAQEYVVDEARIKKAIQSGIPLTITTFALPHETEVHIENIVTTFLRLLDQEKLRDYIVFCVQELAVNAKKANTKRVYFMERGLDLSNPDDYEAGMANFKEDTLSNITYYLQLQEEKGLYIKVILQVKNNIIYLEIRNNAAVTETELIRIQDKLARSRQYNDLEEAMNHVLDDSEGAGLGLVILVLMLKRMGLDKDCFDILAIGEETIARLIVPLEYARLEQLSALSATIVENINSLPQFPENILTVQRLIADPKSEIADIARKISMDPAFTADLLKIVNSAHYMLSRKVDNISDAVKLVGMRGIKNLLYSYGTQKILGEDTVDKKNLWEHSYKTGFFAYNLAKNFQKEKNLPDDAYVGGILHDMGKIIFSNVHPDLLNKIKTFCSERGMSSSIIEDLSAGLNHAEIGALVAEKWNFPEDLVVSIRYHHDPAAAPKEYRKLVDAVYLANMFCELEAGKVVFEQIDSEVLENYGINSKEQAESLLARFISGLKQEAKT